VRPMFIRTLLAASVIFGAAIAARAAEPNARLRGTIEKVDATSLVVKDREGHSTALVYAEDLGVSEVLPIDPAAIQSGTFIGTTAVPAADGSLLAVEVHVFPEAARGTGEGHRPWDLQPGSTMTNATVTAIKPGPNDRALTLRYKDGEKTIHMPNGVPVVTMKAGDRSLLIPGAKVIVTEQMRNGRAVATRIVVGRDGFAPPM
jgi:hypothetical protein